MIKAIVYNTNTEHTKEYAQLLSEELKIPAYSLEETNHYLKKDDEIIYLSWICAGIVTKLTRVKKKYKIKWIGMVGAYPKNDQYVKELQKANQLTIPSFYLQGGLNYSKLKGMKKMIVKLVGKTIPKENTELRRLFQNGGNYVSKESLKELIKFIKNYKEERKDNE